MGIDILEWKSRWMIRILILGCGLLNCSRPSVPSFEGLVVCNGKAFGVFYFEICCVRGRAGKYITTADATEYYLLSAAFYIIVSRIFFSYRQVRFQTSTSQHPPPGILHHLKTSP